MCKHYYYLQNFSSSQTDTLYLLISNCAFPLLPALMLHWNQSSPVWMHLFWIFHVNGIIHHLSFCVWLSILFCWLTYLSLVQYGILNIYIFLYFVKIYLFIWKSERERRGRTERSPIWWCTPPVAQVLGDLALTLLEPGCFRGLE